MKTKSQTIRRFFYKTALLLFILFCALFVGLSANKPPLTASAFGDVIKVEEYQVDMTVRTDRKVEVKERIRVQFLASGLSMFYRSLPVEQARYTNITATCEGNDEFSFYVEDNPDMSGFIDINCTGNADKGKTWTYDLSYVMEHGGNEVENGMHIDVIGFGWSVPLHNVSVTLHFPTAVSQNAITLYSGAYGAQGNEANVAFSFSDEKTLTLTSPKLELVYNDYYEERMAEGISVQFTLGEGVLEDYAKTRILTENMWKIVLGAGIAIGLAAIVALFTPKKQEIVTVVNIKAPDNMDPMKMGKLLDGVVDSEDVTSMIYYFAYKGYLAIDFSDEDDPVLIQRIPALPKGEESVHARTIFNGLFKDADRETIEGETPFDEDQVKVTIKISQLKNRFYESVDKATQQTPKLKMYDKKSIIWYVLGGVIGTLFAWIMPFVASLSVGGGYVYFAGGAFIVPALVILGLGAIKENYRYKWKKKGLIGMTVAQIAIAVVSALIFVGLFATHILTGYEKLVVSVGAILPTFLTLNKLSRTEKYRKTLGQILGFKDFIVVTEEDKIKFMLEENPELYYKILPYAQVLGVTDEWEEKFASITIQPPSWCVGTEMTFFDYMLINRCMTRAMVTALVRPEGSGGGSFIGRSGGGGHFGGFGGGGFGGGGGGGR